MPDITTPLPGIESVDASVAKDLLPLVFGQLRRLAASKMSQEKPGRTLGATALGVRQGILVRRLAGVNWQEDGVGDKTDH